MATQHAYLTVSKGALTGSHFRLDPTDESTIGRGVDCDVVMTDPVASRVHAIFRPEREGWFVRDADSRNGTYVGDQKIDEVRLVDGSVLRIGSTEFLFRLSDQPPTSAGAPAAAPHVAQTIVRETPILADQSGRVALSALQDQANVEDFLLLYQLSLRLLRTDEPEEVLQIALSMLQQRTRASVVGFLWASDQGELKPKVVIPQHSADRITLSETLTEVVLQRRRAVWIANHPPMNENQSLELYADAFCIPLIEGDHVIGAVHVYLGEGRFRAAEYEFGVSLANVLSAALVSARRQASLRAEHQRLADEAASLGELIGESEPMLELKTKITRAAQASSAVLVRGESGAGKELVARALHQASQRADRPMLSVNCAAIAPDLMESQLFGHKRGAFTSAESDHVGWFEQADSGTLFLDEVGEMTLSGQAKLLRVLEGHPFLPVGGTEEVCADVRVIAATNRDLRQFVEEGRFREDLFYRLGVLELVVPPLRERGTDIALLIDRFLEHFRHQHGRPELSLTPEAQAGLLSYHWPGNVRQLRNVLDSAAVMASSDQIELTDLGLREATDDSLNSLRIDHWEKKLIQQALQRSENRVPEAAERLGISRATLYRKIDEYQIER